MRRRALLTSLPVGVSVLAGCLGSVSESNNAADAPAFEANKDAPGEFILLRNQPQQEVTVGDEFEVAVVLGNAGGESITGEVSVELVPPSNDEDVQTATVVVEDGDALASGAARFFIAGLFEATVVGDWELNAGAGIEQVHESYDPTITVREQPTG